MDAYYADLEVSALILATQASGLLARTGQPEAGRALLKRGRERALRYCREGRCLAPELAVLWTDALEEYEDVVRLPAR